MRCSSCQRSASDSPPSTRSSSACAASSCSRARASSISRASTARPRLAGGGFGGRFGLGLLFGLFRLLLGLLAFARELPCLRDRLVDRADHVERLLRKLVVLALDDLLEALDRVLEPHVLAGLAGELLGDEVRLREEALDPARAVDRHLVLVGELVDPENRDDVLQVLVALQDLLDAS